LTRLGVLTTRGHALETLARVNHMILDKTGTLTEGRLQLESVKLLGSRSRQDCLRLAATLEQSSEHPIARALSKAAGSVQRAENVSARPGLGIEGWIDGQCYRIGTAEFVLGMQNGAAVEPATLPPAAGGVVLGNDRMLLAHFEFADRLRDNAVESVHQLKALGIEVELLSGDEAGVVQKVADELKIDRFEARCRPQDKLTRIQALQAQGRVVAMVGDGVNDAPVLAAAQVSLAMGGGTQLAHASADMLLLSEQLPHLVAAVVTSRRTLRIIRQNLVWALVYNLLALPLAAAGWIAPWMAAIGMSSSSLVVVANALRLRH
jgi:Cu2+-exporting ATPase